jgi:hypothetical protein
MLLNKLFLARYTSGILGIPGIFRFRVLIWENSSYDRSNPGQEEFNP